MKNNSFLFTTGLMSAALALCFAVAAEAGQKTNSYIPFASGSRSFVKSPSAKDRAKLVKMTGSIGGDWTVSYSPVTGRPESIMGGRSTKKYTGTAREGAGKFLSENAYALQIDTSSLKTDISRNFMGMSHVRYQQYYKGLPVEFSYVKVHIKDSGVIAGYQDSYSPDIDADVTPSVTELQAKIALKKAFGISEKLSFGSSSLVIYPSGQDTYVLAWKLRARGNSGDWTAYVDAHEGTLLLKFDNLLRASGYSRALVYSIAPEYQIGDTPYTDQEPQIEPMQDQYVWMFNNQTAAVTSEAGAYTFSGNGRVFSTFKGPYFSVVNFRGAASSANKSYSAFWANSPVSRTVYSLTGTVSANSEGSYTGNLSNFSSNSSLAAIAPVFSYFDAGDVTSEEDAVYLSTSADKLATYAGSLGQFIGPLLEGQSFAAAYHGDNINNKRGFSISNALVYTLDDSTAACSSSACTYDIYWSSFSSVDNSDVTFYADTAPFSASARNEYNYYGYDEANAFYHLNKARLFFDNLSGGDSIFDNHLDVMVHFYTSPDYFDIMRNDSSTEDDGYSNSFYDSENKMLMFGDGTKIKGDGDAWRFRSYAIDGTVVRHEYVHFVVNQIYPIINIGEFGAISEALSDFFSLASFWREGYKENDSVKKNLDTVLYYVDNSAARKLSKTDANLSDWAGEIYTDSAILSQTLYALAHNDMLISGDRATFPGDNGQTIENADMGAYMAYAALYYYPSSFANFGQAMYDVCTDLKSKSSTAAGYSGLSGLNCASISSEFSLHGVDLSSSTYTEELTNDAYESVTSSGCVNNNGPACATSAGNITSFSATVYPASDSDYYSFTSAKGDITVSLSMPEISTGVYNAYTLSLYDANYNLLARSFPKLTEGYYYCGDGDGLSSDCRTFIKTVSVSHSSSSSGIYYVGVSGGLTLSYGTEEGFWGNYSKEKQYTLTLEYPKEGSVEVEDNKISGDKFIYSYDCFVYKSSCTYDFDHAVLKNSDKATLDETSTSTGTLLSVYSQGSTNYDTGKVSEAKLQLADDFYTSYPYVGTVYLEVFGKNKNNGNVQSLGVSDAVTLSATEAEFNCLDNIIAPDMHSKAKFEWGAVSSGGLTIKIYTQVGNLVRTIYSGSISAGTKADVYWDGTNDKGNKVASGVYFVKADGPGIDKICKVAVIR